MSLGAIDFGLIIDGAVVMVENIVRHLGEKAERHLGRQAQSAKERLEEVVVSARGRSPIPMFFGVHNNHRCLHVPILALAGIEGKMFKPHGAHCHVRTHRCAHSLALTLMPVLCSFFLKWRDQGEGFVAG